MTRPTINTVCGPISPDELGVTLVHEHIVYGQPGWYGDTVAPYDRSAVRDAAIERMEELRGFGVTTFVDATPNDTGRDPLLYRDVAEASGMQIICSTGYYPEFDGATGYFKFRQMVGNPPEEIYELLTTEITEGIGDTGVRAGVIKTGSSHDEITDYERMFMTAAARVQRDTGVPIITHTELGTMGPEQAELLIAEGADPSRIMIGHMSDNDDLSYQRATLDQGVSVAFDRMGLEVTPEAPNDERRIACLIELIAAGYGDRIMISHDSILHWLGRPIEVPDEVAPLIANWEPTHLFRNVIPALQEGGVTDDQIQTIIEHNPRRLFGGRAERLEGEA
jgi:phosphotriesterase-related protein